METETKHLKPIRLIAIDEKTKSKNTSYFQNYPSISKQFSGFLKMLISKNISVSSQS